MAIGHSDRRRHRSSVTRTPRRRGIGSRTDPAVTAARAGIASPRVPAGNSDECP
ncbi:hypothetical protein EBESD8_36920 [Rhodococcus aetherivorans]|nr:hypothetical protein EBESD8_36920 [Rhodococcus aetherivorans]